VAADKAKSGGGASGSAPDQSLEGLEASCELRALTAGLLQQDSLATLGGGGGGGGGGGEKKAGKAKAAASGGGDAGDEGGPSSLGKKGGGGGGGSGAKKVLPADLGPVLGALCLSQPSLGVDKLVDQFREANGASGERRESSAERSSAQHQHISQFAILMYATTGTVDSFEIMPWVFCLTNA